jgi:hypothetical protein
MTRNARLRLVLGVSLALASSALSATAPGQTVENRASPGRRALNYLLARQLQQPINIYIGDRPVLQDYPGNWPQFFSLRGTPQFLVREVSPFMVAYVHHALTHVVKANRRALGLSPRDLLAARWMRRRAVEFMLRFESSAGTADAGTFGFWPYDQEPDLPRPFIGSLLLDWLRGPILGGDRVPLNLRVFPSPLAIPTDADVTATTYAVLADDALIDGGSGSAVPFERFFVDWRDLGNVPRRRNPPWLPPASGAFLTWLTYQHRSYPLYPNDVDLVVNANVLFALGRYHRLDVPGVDEAVSLINLAVALGLHRDHPEEISEYYPDNFAFHYAVSRAFHEGGVSTLEPAVETLADGLESTVIERSDGKAYWDHGAPQLNTAFAILTLLNAGRNTPLVTRAVAYLVGAQNIWGGFDAATFFIARADGGQVFEFSSASFTTAMALEAFSRFALARHLEQQPTHSVADGVAAIATHP